MNKLSLFLTLIVSLLAACTAAAPPEPRPAPEAAVPAPAPVAAPEPQPAPLPDPEVTSSAPYQIKEIPAPRHSRSSGRSKTASRDRGNQKILAKDVSAAAGRVPGQETNELNSYEVKVSATEKIRLSADKNVPSSGLMKVWIGQPKFEPKTLSGMQSASSVLQSSSPAASAKVIPSFPDDPSAFKVAPETSRCQIIDPTGTEVSFTITPTKLGKARVGADVELYNQPECKGDMLTKTASPVTVEVHSYIPWWQWLIETLWSFIKEIVAALLAILLIVFRKKLGKLFGVEEKT